VRNFFSNKMLQQAEPLDGDGGWTPPKQRKAPKVVTPTPAQPVGANTDANTIKAQAQRFGEQTKAAYRREQDQLQAEIELEEYRARGVELEIRAAGGDPTKSDKLADSRRFIERRRERIAALDRQIAVLEHRMQERIERGPEVVAAYIDGTASLLKGLAELKPLYDDLVRRRQDVFDLLFEHAPNGAPTMVGLPNSGSLFSIVKQLDKVLGADYPNKSVLARLLDDAGASGIEVK
jgi:hypothetical protein